MNYKEMFEQWYNEKYGSFGMQFFNPTSEEPEITTLNFGDFPIVYRQGVWREFFESKGILIEVFTSNPRLTFGYKVVNEGGDLLDDGFPDYNTAFNTAIETAEKVLEWVK